MDIEGRAADLLERLEVLGMAGGLSEEDLYSNGVREPFCACCSQLADTLASLPAEAAFVDDPQQLSSAAANLKAVASSQREAAQGRLQRALARLVSAIDPSAAGGSRVEQLEIAVAQLQAAHILAHKQQPGTQQQQHPGAAAEEAMQVDDVGDTAAAATSELRLLAKLLGLDASRSRALPVLQEVLPKVQSLVSQLPAGFFQPLVAAQLSQLDGGQQDVLREVDDALQQEYCLRRRMLIERVKVTVQSFLWSPRLTEQGTRAQVEALVATWQDQLQQQQQPGVGRGQLATATAADLAGVMRRATSGEGGTFDASVKRVVIGKVPDRGGRPEGRSREANMPDWAPRKEAAAGGGGGGGRHGGRRGARSDGGGGRSGGGGGGRGGGQGHTDPGADPGQDKVQGGSSSARGRGGGRGGWGRGRR